MLFGRKNQTTADAPIGLVNLHCHILAGVDDGAQDDEQMYDLMRLEYECGVRHLCFTPHYNPALFKPKPDKIAESFEKAQMFAQKELPELSVYLGNEVFMRPDTIERIRDKSCKPLGDSRVILAEFGYTTPFDELRQQSVQLMTAGKTPLFAHIERYNKLDTIEEVLELKDIGVKLQINTEAFTSPKKKLINKLVEQGIIDVIADDRHSRRRGEPNLAETYRFVSEKYGTHAAEALFIHRPASILNISVK